MLLSMPWISLTVFLPLVGAAVLALVPGEHRQLHRHITVAFMTATFLASLALWAKFDPSLGTYQLTTGFEDLAWIPGLGARYHVGIDGISLWLVLLTTLLGPIVVLSGYSAVDDRVKEYHIALLLLQTAMLGALVSLDLLLFYVFWELMLVPMYLLIGIWGGQQRIYAALKLFLYTMAGSVLMLIALIYVYVKAGGTSFDLQHMTETARGLSFTEQVWLFLAFGVAFLIKVPVFPFHTWLPDAHVQAPTAGSVILASILLKMGTYGIVRFLIPMFPDGAIWAAPYVAVLSVVGIFYGAVVAWVQKDVKKLIAYSSVSHLGFVTLGLFALTSESVMGACYQGLAHGVSTGGLFLGIGVLYERRHTRALDAFGGLAKQMPFFSVLFVIISLASAGVPGLVGFVGEFMILTGSSASYTLGASGITHFGSLEWGPDRGSFFVVALAASGVILGAVYLLWMLQNVIFGPLAREENRRLPDLSLREAIYLLPIVALCFVMGIWPQFFVGPMQASVERVVSEVEANAVEYRALVAAHAQNESEYAAWSVESEEPRWSLQALGGEAGGAHEGGRGDGEPHGEGGERGAHDAEGSGGESHGGEVIP